MTIYRMKQEEKRNGKWVLVNETEDYETCYYHFASDMNGRFLCGYRTIKMVKRVQHYNCTAIFVYFDNGFRNVYICNA